MKDRLPIPPTGYDIVIDGQHYEGYNRGPRAGEAFTLLDAWREIEGVRNAHIIAPSGRIVWRNAGSMQSRREMREHSRRRRAFARNVRSHWNGPTERGTCDLCGGLVYRDLMYRRAWHHVPSLTCDIELTHVNVTPERIAA